MNDKPTLIGLLRERLDYDPKTGVLVWKKTGNNFVKPGQVSGSIDRKGYVKVKLFNKSYAAHRIAWAITHEEWPGEIDHINGNPSDNRICNLRNVSRRENSCNIKLKSNNTSGLFGVHWLTKRNRWVARITVDGSRVALGYYTNIFDAACARKSAELKYQYHPNHGRKGVIE